MNNHPLEFRYDVRPDDRETVRRLVQSTGVFSPVEVDVAVELVDDRLERGCQSDYHFVFAELDGRTVGYTCYGPIALTAASFDLYWIAVDKSLHGRKIGQALLEKTEELVRQAGGRQVYIETSNRHQYAPTRGFYLRGGYRQEALLERFLRPRRRQGDLREGAVRGRQGEGESGRRGDKETRRQGDRRRETGDRETTCELMRSPGLPFSPSPPLPVSLSPCLLVSWPARRRADNDQRDADQRHDGVDGQQPVVEGQRGRRSSCPRDGQALVSCFPRWPKSVTERAAWRFRGFARGRWRRWEALGERSQYRPTAPTHRQQHQHAAEQQHSVPPAPGGPGGRRDGHLGRQLQGGHFEHRRDLQRRPARTDDRLAGPTRFDDELLAATAGQQILGTHSIGSKASVADDCFLTVYRRRWFCASRVMAGAGVSVHAIGVGRQSSRYRVVSCQLVSDGSRTDD